MDLIQWNPFRELDQLNHELQHTFGFSPHRLPYRPTAPRIDVYQTEKDVVVKAEIPGMSKKDLNVYVDESVIRLSGETKRNAEFKEENIYRSERYYGTFSRVIPLPVKVKSEEATANYSDGVLSIMIPKRNTSTSNGRRLPIN